ncbi:SAM hydrolase/SAM-dependent halogenase family protein [Natronospira bacteriovora]|uniref:SAM-dependent chlorinase/fluorinase n=1 Tax=Natronospira bacteriovora TaxID=3069753 RepID=A0ABU0W6D8_9GAMM|nr:SAM-dependent chlorinase/fluorinase [Natronospira sp. AB-CW4]MDQ2069561.1 SAM-dependent chlorinase/fluorinase [Natronospira sp. AB-CW4]
MLFAYTDFHHRGPYVGELEAAALRHCRGPFIHLMHDAPAFDAATAGLLLAGLSRQFRPGDICLAIVDPGVGGPRWPVALKADGCWYVGPDNGLLTAVAEQSREQEWWEITWQPEDLSSSFHGRDQFAPFAGQLASGRTPTAIGARPLHDPVTLATRREQILYIDGYGNAVTGIEGHGIQPEQQLSVAGQTVDYAFTFTSVPRGTPLWYINSMGLVEIAINQASAAEELGLAIGSPIEVESA